VAVPQGGIDWLRTSLADFLELAALMTPQELVANLKDMQHSTGLSFPLVAALSAGPVSGPEAPGVPATSNPVVIGARDNIGNVQRLFCDPFGVQQVISPPSVRLFVVDNAPAAGVAATVTLAAQATGKWIISAALLSIACGATPVPAASVLMGNVHVAVACPANDTRQFLIEGPINGGINTALTFTGPPGVAGVVQALYVCGYTSPV
jgi:hypothetical protein